VTGRQVCIFGVLIGGDDFRVYRVERDDETIAAIREKEVEFWGRIQRLDPPEATAVSDILRLFERDAGTSIETVYGKLESIAAKDKMKAVIVVNHSSPNKHDLLDAVNEDCLLIIGGAAEFLDGMKDVKADPDQNPLDLNGGDHEMEVDGAWGGEQQPDDDVVDAEFQELPQLTVERFAGHTLGEIAIGVATKKDVFDAAWLQSRFALTTEEAERVVLQLLDQGVIVLEQENEESRELNTYRVVKKPGDIALDLE
ncbi:hypothetical protein, partial [Pseudomonas aeruginosa]|uniref:hypothetical protein n=1 Tax=Pseudomonas aeruginosa TaxID=287 RepID=UPI0023585448